MNTLDVFLVDDEAIVLDYFQNGFPWKEAGFRLAGLASNGKEAVEACVRLEPDLIVLDISMPGMTGMEVMERLIPMLPYSSFAFITSHEDFKHVHEALRLGAIDYILKASMIPAELLEKFSSIRDRILERRKKEGGSAEERLLRNLPALAPSTKGEAQSELSAIPPGIREMFTDSAFVVALIRLTASGLSGEEESCTGITLRNETERISGILNAKKNTLPILHAEMDDGQHVMILFSSLGTKGSLSEIALTLIENLTRETYGGICTHTGISTPRNTLAEAGLAYEEAREALFDSFYNPDKKIHVYEKPWKPLDRNFENRLNSLKDGDVNADISERYGSQARKIIRLAQEERLPPDHTRMIVAGLLSRIAKSLGSNDSTWETSLWPMQAAHCPSSRELELWVEEKMSFILLSSGITRLKPRIQRVVDEIEKSFSSPLDLASAASLAAMHPNYFSAIFKQEVGHTFNEHMNAVRIRHAIEYIDEGVWQMQQIAEMVGIPNYRTFFNTFMRVMRMTPTDYLQRKNEESDRA